MLLHAFFLIEKFLTVAVQNAGKVLRLTDPCMFERIIVLESAWTVLALELEFG